MIKLEGDGNPADPDLPSCSSESVATLTLLSLELPSQPRFATRETRSAKASNNKGEGNAYPLISLNGLRHLAQLLMIKPINISELPYPVTSL